jgi:hypothetical protein
MTVLTDKRALTCGGIIHFRIAIHFAVDADGAAFEDAFFAGLNTSIS